MRLDAMPVDLSTPQAQQQALEWVVGAALTGKINSRAAQAVVSAVLVSARLYDAVLIAQRIRALEVAKR